MLTLAQTPPLMQAVDFVLASLRTLAAAGPIQAGALKVTSERLERECPVLARVEMFAQPDEGRIALAVTVGNDRVSRVVDAATGRERVSIGPVTFNACSILAPYHPADD